MTPTRDNVLDDAIRWMAWQIDEARAARAGDAVESAHERPRSKSLLDRFAAKCLKLPLVGQIVPEKPQPGVARPLVIDPRIARGEALERLQTNPVQPEEKDDVAFFATAICAQWEKPEASNLARAWLCSGEIDTEALMNGDEIAIAILVGVAAAAAVFAVVFLVRRGRTVRVPHHGDLAPSPDFQALCAVASGPGNAADLASRLRDSVSEPWTWTARDGVLKRTVDDKRALLEAFAAEGACGVSRIRPATQDPFDAQYMTTDARTTNDDLWVVSSDVPAERVGFRFGDHVEVHARVEVCTIDWWLLSMPSCPVGQKIGERSDDLVAGGKMGSRGWRAPWGLAHPEDLRELFDEPTLEVWRKRMIAELNPRYLGRPERCLSIVGAPGDVFESSIMEVEGSVPIGDATVDTVVDRQGTRQQGLACPGGSPLLLAIVRSRPVGPGLT
jgi:hypothetical protein